MITEKQVFNALKKMVSKAKKMGDAFRLYQSDNTNENYLKKLNKAHLEFDEANKKHTDLEIEFKKQ